MATANSSQRRVPVYETGKRHEIQWSQVLFQEAKFDWIFAKAGISEDPSKHDHYEQSSLNNGVPIQGKWLYVFMTMSGSNTKVLGKKMSGDEFLTLKADSYYTAFLANQPLTEQRLKFYTAKGNDQHLRDRGFSFSPDEFKEPTIFLIDYLDIAKRLLASYRKCTEAVHKIAANPKVFVANLAHQAETISGAFRQAAQEDFPQLLAFGKKARHQLDDYNSKIISRSEALSAIKIAPGFNATLADLLAAHSTQDDALKAWDECTDETELGYFKFLANPGPTQRSVQEVYDKIQLVKPFEQMAAAGALHSALRKQLIVRFMQGEIVELKQGKHGKAALRKALESFSTEVESLLDKNPKLLKSVAKSGGHTFLLQEKGSRLVWKSSQSGLDKALDAGDISHHSSFQASRSLERGFVSIAAAVEIVNVYCSFQLMREAQRTGKDETGATLSFASDTFSALNAVGSLGQNLAKTQVAAKSIGTEAANVAEKALGRWAVGLGVVGSAIGFGNSLSKAISSGHVVSKDGLDTGVAFVGLAQGSAQLAVVLGLVAEESLIGGAAGPVGILAVFVVSAGAATITWYASDRIEKWPNKFADISNSLKLKWIDPLDSSDNSEGAKHKLQEEANHLARLMFPFDVRCYVDRFFQSTIGAYGTGGGPSVSAQFVVEIKTGGSFGSEVAIEIENLKYPLSEPAIPPRLIFKKSQLVHLGMDVYQIRLPYPKELCAHRYDYEISTRLDILGDGNIRTTPKSAEGVLVIVDHFS